MTPTEHKATAQTRVENFYRPGRLGPTYTDQTLAEAHAHLSQATGSGEHYATADQLLAQAAQAQGGSIHEDELARQALIHAILADR